MFPGARILKGVSVIVDLQVYLCILFEEEANNLLMSHLLIYIADPTVGLHRT
jgi:hypothetical protein